jgi:hypothetical protein
MWISGRNPYVAYDLKGDSDYYTGDDLSMLIATTTVLHRVVTFDKPLSVTVSFGLASTAFVALFFTWHCMVDDTLVHPILFGIPTFLISSPQLYHS